MTTVTVNETNTVVSTSEKSFDVITVGVTGPAGSTGGQGIPGLDGKSVWTGNSAPIDPVTFPLWLHDDSAILYGYIDSQWVDLSKTGPQGEQGVGVPDGGLTGMVLSKVSGSNYDTAWITLPPDDAGDIDPPIGSPIFTLITGTPDNSPNFAL